MKSHFNIKGNFFRSILTALFLTFFLQVKSQVFYSTRPDYISQKTEGNNLLRTYTFSYPDTSLNSIHDFFPRNYLGNVGLPSPSYILNYGTDKLGFRLFPSPMTNDLFREEQVQYSVTKGPFANLTGIAGSKQLQILKLFFSQTYKDKLNLTLKFNRYSSTGYYLRQQTYTNNLFLSSNYTSEKKRAGYYFYFLTNSNKYQESGGIRRGILTDSTLYESKELIPVRISNAVRDNKEYKVMINPWLRLGKGDSLSRSGHFLQLKSKLNINTYKYTDANPHGDKFYAIMYLDTVKTKDSTRVMQIINSLDYSFVSSNAAFSLGYKNEINQVWQKADSVFYNDFITADAVLRKSFGNDSSRSVIESHFNAQYVFSGASAGDYKIENHTFFSPSSKFSQRLWMNLMYEQRHADYIYNYWVGNHFLWLNNGYKPQEMLQVKLGYNFNRKFGVSALYQQMNNYLYFDNVAQPRQFNGTIQNISLNATANLVFFKHLGLFVNETVQSTSHSAYVSIPPQVTTARLYYTGSHYKNNLQIQAGVQAQYYASFFGYGYMPATQIFYLQDQVRVGEYPFVDVYLNARIRPVNVFLKLENILQGSLGNNYFMVPGYYQPELAFRFGINWMFFD